ncbi:Methyltransferase type 11 [Desulfotomaculum nigrificans CO-1-SRB]|uniref:Methyltransferase type 11 n=1 Tax=Desulfotomaculum nigrificans (strain DSM 14880 / VKM B-2319 / CO-1-SRB) TaxID=868595 RepID=F6B3B9_DESCC|nr:class I SAM-dependent methyltransferase [Desulfotomaculum nigrificans]AEF95150.1 Methyltransferase type 11 [Desulfotomaculum nigrificans CO-1-SRB]
MYKELSQYYDDIFPAGAAQLNFFRQTFTDLGVNRVLDLACGSGNYALEFARWGLNVVALDYEQEMIKLGREKARQAGLTVDFRTGDMRDLEDIPGKFDAVICIGNSLAHLLTDKDVLTTLNQIKEHLYHGGTFILQTVNYDRILKGHITQLPDIINNQAGIIFTRHYDFRPDGLIDFKTALIKNGPNGSQQCLGTGQVPLRPFTKNELAEFLQQAGFVDISFYGNFNYKPHGWDSQSTVVQAFRRRSCSIT